MNWFIWFLFSPKGRIGRAPFIGFAICASALYFGLVAFLTHAFERAPQDWAHGAPTFELASKWLPLAFLPIAWMTFAVCAKRLHDFNWSGFWQLLPVVLQKASPMAMSYLVTLLPEPSSGDMSQLVQHRLQVLQMQIYVLYGLKALAIGMLALLALRPGNAAGMRHATGPVEDEALPDMGAADPAPQDMVAGGWAPARPASFGRRRAA